MKEKKWIYEKEDIYIFARNNKRTEYHIAKIISKGETSNSNSVGNASTKCLRYYKNTEYSIAEKEPAHGDYVGYGNLYPPSFNEEEFSKEFDFGLKNLQREMLWTRLKRLNGL